MDLEEQQLVIKWRSLAELKEKLRTILGELEIGTTGKVSQDVSATFSSTFSPGEPVPDEIRKVGLNKFSAAMVESLRHGHRGRSAAIDARRLAIEMKQRYPALFGRKDLGKIAHGTIFPGKKLAEAGLIRMEKVHGDEFPGQTYRLYWVE